MPFAAGTIADVQSTHQLCEAFKALCGTPGARNWSEVSNVPPGAGRCDVWRLTLSDWDSGDTFRMSFMGVASVLDVEYSSNAAAAIQAAIESIPGFRANEVQVSWQGGNVYNIAAYPGGPGRFDISGFGPWWAIADATGDTPPSGAFSQWTNPAVVTGISSRVRVFKCAGTGDDANDAGHDWYLAVSDRSCCEVQSINQIVYGESGKTFTLTFDGHTTAPISWNANANTLALAIQSALEALPNIDPGDIIVGWKTVDGVNGWDIWFEPDGQYGYQTLTLMTFGSSDGLYGYMATTVAGSGSGASDVFNVSIAEEFDGTLLKFRKLVSAQAGSQWGVGCAVDDCAAANPGGSDWVGPAAAVDSVGHWSATLNKSGFSYQIKLTKNFLMVGVRAGGGSFTCYAGLMDSFLESPLTDPLPLVLLGSGMTVGQNGAFIRLPGVGVQSATNYSFGVLMYPWTFASNEGLCNGVNYNDLWVGNKIYAARALVAHQVGSSLSYIWGLNRGLLKSDVLIIPTGGTVNIGDTMQINGETWTCMGTCSSWILFVKGV